MPGRLKEDDLTKTQNSIRSYFRNRYELVKSGRNWRSRFRLSDALLTGIDNYLLAGVAVCLILTRAMNPFVLLKSS